LIAGHNSPKKYAVIKPVTIVAMAPQRNQNSASRWLRVGGPGARSFEEGA
jgi:hypothetical protein